jgi:UDP-glucuronate 4-epimerase
LEGRPVRLFNFGRMRRDFTYVDDVIEAITRLIRSPPSGGTSEGADKPVEAPCRVHNIGNSHPVETIELVRILEKVTGRRAQCELLPMRPIDVLETYADTSELERAVGFTPGTPIEAGLRSFVEWFRGFAGSDS